MKSKEWFEKQAAANYPSLLRGDIFLSMKRGNIISSLIALFQKKGDALLVWSHTGIYVGGGQIAEATMPHGGVARLDKYLGNSYVLSLYRIPTLTPDQRMAICSEAVRLAPRNYDKLKIAKHLVDNLFERLTWNEATQTGWRPLSHIWKDDDSKNVCSELDEWAYWNGARIKFQDGPAGMARPEDIYDYLEEHEHPLIALSDRGQMVVH